MSLGGASKKVRCRSSSVTLPPVQRSVCSRACLFSRSKKPHCFTGLRRKDASERFVCCRRHDRGPRVRVRADTDAVLFSFSPLFLQDERKRLKNAIIIQSYIRGFQERKRQVRGTHSHYSVLHWSSEPNVQHMAKSMCAHPYVYVVFCKKNNNVSACCSVTVPLHQTCPGMTTPPCTKT